MSAPYTRYLGDATGNRYIRHFALHAAISYRSLLDAMRDGAASRKIQGRFTESRRRAGREHERPRACRVICDGINGARSIFRARPALIPYGAKRVLLRARCRERENGPCRFLPTTFSFTCAETVAPNATPCAKEYQKRAEGRKKKGSSARARHCESIVRNPSRGIRG